MRRNIISYLAESPGPPQGNWHIVRMTSQDKDSGWIFSPIFTHRVSELVQQILANDEIPEGCSLVITRDET